MVTIEKQGEAELHRSLKPRHMNMIAIGGAIGTGLFFASGNAVSSAGPGGALTAYAIMGLLVYFLMTSLGEMATFMPISGSFETYATRFVDPAFGFALGWNYWYSWAITVACELAAAALIMKFWFPNTQGWIWSIFFLAILFALNMMSARAYGEGEFWFAGIKVTVIIIFLVVGVLMIFGILGGKSPGFENWVLAGPDGAKAPFVGGFIAIVNILMVAGFSFQGTELVGLAAGESENPEVNVPKAINTVFWRILIFYIGAITVIGFLIPFTDPNLLKSGEANIAVSPFTLMFKRSGIAFAASMMNAVILSSVLSCGNSGLYAGSRMLYAMAVEGKAPKVFATLNKGRVPMVALIFTTLVAATSFLSSIFGDGTIYTWLVSASGLTGFIAWLGIAICHYRFRKAYVAQGRKLSDLKYTAKWYPFGPVFAAILCGIVILGQNYSLFFSGNFNFGSFMISYIGLPVFLVLWLGYKFVKKTKVVPLMECDFTYEDKHKTS